MARGTLFLVVGASGSGKDTLIREAKKRRPDLYFVKRAVTRPAGDANEDHIALDATTFAKQKLDQTFSLSWDANGYRYGVPADMEDRLNDGTSAVLNASRSIVEDARRKFQPLRVIHVVARLDDLARRLRARGREDDATIERRLARANRDEPVGADVTVVRNDGTVEEGVVRFLAALQ